MGKLISFEGCQGTGKTTQFKNVSYKMRELGYFVETIAEKDYEPSKSVVQKWRNSNLNKTDSYDVDTILEMAKARAIVNKKIIKPLLDKNDFIFLDRCYLTNAIYQCGFGLNINEIIDIQLKLGVLKIDSGFIFECHPNTSYKRAKERNFQEYASGGGFEREGKRFMVPIESLEKLTFRHNLYHEIPKYYPEFQIIDTDMKSKEEITNELITIILEKRYE